MAAVRGMADVRSRYSVPDTLDRLEAVLRERGLKVFTRIDHAREAEAVGLTLRPTQLLVFGNPSIGTPVMVRAPRIAIELPFKALAWKDGDGQVWLSYNTPKYLQERHGLPAEMVKGLAGIEVLIGEAVE